MDSADSAVSAILLRLTSPQVLGAVLALLVAGVIALLVARALRVRRALGPTAAQHRPHWLDHTLEGALILAPLMAALATLLAGHAALAALATPTAVIDGALKIVGALALLRFGVYLLGRMLGPEPWLGTREDRTTFVLWLIAGVALLGRLDAVDAAGVDVTTLNVLTGAIGLGLGFGLQSVASNFVSGFVLLMDKSIKPGDVISFTTGTSGASAGNFGWVQELRGRYVVVRDRDGV